MEKFLTTINKLAIDSDKDSAVGDVFIARPKEELKNKLGTIIGIIELFGQPDEFADKFYEIINDLETEYYLPPFENEGGTEKRFEECLQRANRRINKIINDSIEELEIKNINTLIVLIKQDKIYLSQIGKSNAFLFHKKKKHDYLIVDIFSQAGEKRTKIDQEKMFSNIINGAITEKDHLFFCNDSILEHLSQNELMEITTSGSPAQAIKEIKKSLASEVGIDNFYSIIIEPVALGEDEDTKKVSLIQTSKPRYIETPNEIKKINKIPPQTSINKLISTQESTEKFLAPSMAPNWKKALMLISAWSKKLALLILKYSKISAKKLIELTKFGINAGKRKINDLNKRNHKQENIIVQGDENIEEKEIEIEETPHINKNKKINEEILPEAIEEKKYIKETNPSEGLAQKISDFINSQINNFLLLNKIQQTLLVIAVILVFFFSQSMVWQGRAGSLSSKINIDDKITQINEHLNTGEAKNIFNDEDGAKESIRMAMELLNEIPNNKKYESLKEELQKRIDEINKSLQKIAYIEKPIIISDLSNQNTEADIPSISKSGNFIFAPDNKNQNIYKIDLEKKQTTSNQLSNNFNNIRKITATDEKDLLILNGDKELYKYNFENNLMEIALVANNKINDFGIYGGKLYTLQSDTNQILKHFPIETGYNSGSNWIKDGSNMENIISITIDGGIYTADTNGEIKYFMAGKSEPTNLSIIDPPLSSPKQLFSKIDSNYLYILDQNNNKIIVIDKNSGNIKIQYLSKEFKNIKSIIVEEQEKKIYVLSDKKIYLIEMNF